MQVGECHARLDCKGEDVDYFVGVISKDVSANNFARFLFGEDRVSGTCDADTEVRVPFVG